jgi:hypothetical protein
MECTPVSRAPAVYKHALFSITQGYTMNSFLAIIQIAKLIAALIPAAIALVQSVEAAMPGSKGAEKLGVVKAALQSAYAVEQGVEHSFETVWPALSATISGIVAAYNAAGTFKKS